MAAATGAGSVELDGADVVRLVLQFLQESNLPKAMQALQGETGVTLNTVDSVEHFKVDVQAGRWDKVLEQVASLKLPERKLMDMYAHIVKELLAGREFDAARTTLRSTLACNLMKQKQPEQYKRLEYLLSVGETDTGELFPGSSAAKERARLADSLGMEVTTAPPSRLLALLGQALKWQQHVGVLPPGGRFNVFQGVAPRLRELRDKPATVGGGKLRMGGAHALALLFSPDGTRVVTGSNEGFVEVWDAVTRKLDKRLPYQVMVGEEPPALLMHDAGVMGLGMSIDGALMASGTTTGEIKVWAVDSGSCLRSFPGAHSGGVTALAFSKDCTHLLSSSTDGTAKVHGLRSGKTMKEFRGHTSFVNAAAFVEGESQVVTASADGSVRLWDVKSARQVGSFKPPQESDTEDAPVLDVVPLPRSPGRFLVVSRCRDIHIMSAEGTVLSTLQVVRGAGASEAGGTRVIAGAISPRELFVYALTDAGQVHVLDVGSGEEVHVQKVAERQALGVCHHPTTNMVATHSEDAKVMLWNAAS